MALRHPSGTLADQAVETLSANGQRAEQNNFILDGVDNNTNLVDFLNGSSYIMRPPPDALSEFSLQTSNFSSEFGHSAGAVLQANLKSGTNQIHGDLWEYFRNTNLDGDQLECRSQCGGSSVSPEPIRSTLGFPIWKNKLFYFGDIEVNRISISNPTPMNVPSALERQGDFSELLNGDLTGLGAHKLYEPNTADPNQPMVCNGRPNVLCANQINAVAQNILNLYPAPMPTLASSTTTTLQMWAIATIRSSGISVWTGISTPRTKAMPGTATCMRSRLTDCPLARCLTAAVTADSTTPTWP